MRCEICGAITEKRHLGKDLCRPCFEDYYRFHRSIRDGSIRPDRPWEAIYKEFAAKAARRTTDTVPVDFT